jgi:hypothetical protein
VAGGNYFDVERGHKDKSVLRNTFKQMRSAVSSMYGGWKCAAVECGTLWSALCVQLLDARAPFETWSARVANYPLVFSISVALEGLILPRLELVTKWEPKWDLGHVFECNSGPCYIQSRSMSSSFVLLTNFDVLD